MCIRDSFNGANKLDTFAFMPIQSFATAATTFVGQNLSLIHIFLCQNRYCRRMASMRPLLSGTPDSGPFSSRSA